MKYRGDQLHDRFHRLRKIIATWEMRVLEAPKQVMDLFYKNDLEGIGQLMNEANELRLRICELDEFIRKWENPGNGAVEVSKIDNE